MWNAWGVSWAGSWGESWGPLHRVEEYPSNFEQGVAGKNKPARDYLSENLLRQQKARDQKVSEKYNLHLDDTLATELLMALVTEGFFDGDF